MAEIVIGDKTYTEEAINEAFEAKLKFDESAKTLKDLEPMLTAMSKKDRAAFDEYAKGVFGDVEDKDKDKTTTKMTDAERLEALEKDAKERKAARAKREEDRAVEKAFAAASKKYGSEFDEEKVLAFMVEHKMAISQIDLAVNAMKGDAYKDFHDKYKAERDKKKKVSDAIIGDKTTKKVKLSESDLEIKPGENMVQAARRLNLKL